MERAIIELSVPASEHAQWVAEANKRNVSLERWLRTLANFAIAAEVEGERITLLGRRRLLSAAAMDCAFCGAGLGHDRTIRKRYCSERCRVAAWRIRQRTARKIQAVTEKLI